MRNKLLSALVIFLLLACAQNNEEINIDENKSVTRALVNKDYPSTSNPTLIDNWENLNDAVLNSGSRVSLPWISGSPSTVPIELSTDIKKEDGWILLIHTLQEVGLDVGQNYLIFYNELRGVLKVFYYKEGQPSPSNGFLWYIEQNSSTSTIFDNGEYFSSPKFQRSDTYAQLTNASTNPVNGLVGQSWNCFELQIPYTESRIENFSISAYNNTISNFTFEGKTESTITGTIMQAKEKKAGISVPSAVANLASGGSKSFIDNLTKSTGLSQKIKNAINKVSKDDYSSAIKSGVKFLSGSIFGWKTDSIAQVVNLKSVGTITLSGTSSTSLVGQIAPLTLFGNKGLNDAYGGNLGLWDLNELPNVYYERYTPFCDERGSAYATSSQTVSSGSVSLPLIEYGSVYITINPAISKYITHRSVEADFFFYFAINGEHYYNDRIKNHIHISDVEKIVWGQNKIYQLKYNPPMQQVNASGTMGRGFNYYDWGNPQTIGLKCGVSITVSLEINYNGKKHSIISTRNYKTNVVEMDYNKDIPNLPGNNVVYGFLSNPDSGW